MSDLFSVIQYYFTFDFVRYAFLVGTLIALCSALFGVILVLKRFSFIGDGLSHTAFGALAVATVLRVSNPLYVVLPVTAVLAVLLLKAGQNRKIKGDASLAMVSVGALAVGYLLLNILPASTNVSGDVCGTLFGATSILTLSKADVLLCMALALTVTVLFVVLYNRIFSITFDENFARSMGIHTGAYNTIVAIVTAVIIVLAMNLVGSLLVSALVVFPALSAMRLFRSFRGVTLGSAVLGTLCAAIGILGSIILSVPVGPAVVAVNIIAFLLFFVLGKAFNR
ncbi:MAG: metal ABC transporter permease [Clostridia bacterium]|nr:metal ABC transporter permease [Clostridia bacterium]